MSTNTGEQSGAGGGGAPAMINPHNPDFLTKKPWYLSGEGGAAAASSEPTLEHQVVQKIDRREELTLSAAERLIEEKRLKEKQLLQRSSNEQVFYKGQWVEAYKKGKPPYRICQILRVHGDASKNRSKLEYDLQFEDGTVERKVKSKSKKTPNKPRIRCTKTGNRAIQQLDDMKETYDSKRDSYHGYDRDSHNRKINAKYEERESIRRQFREEEKLKRKKEKQLKKQQKKKEGGENGDGGGADSDEDDSDEDNRADSENDEIDSDQDDGGDGDEEFVQRDEDAKVITSRLARQGGVGGAQMKVTARNLRIREDTAKYLRNLDPNSAYYDPKSRSMRDNPNPELAADVTDFAGDNFARISGDAIGFAETQMFAWDAQKQGLVANVNVGESHAELHPQANPSQAELLKKQYKSKESELKLQRKKAVLDKYGGAEYLDGTDGLASAADGADNTGKNKTGTTIDRKLRFGVNTVVEEYSSDGRLLKKGGKEVKYQPLPCKYEEDVYMNGHSTVWGSYFHKGAFQWGYADDHSLMRNSYCTGDNGRIANDEANEMKYGTGIAGSAQLAQVRGLLKSIPTKRSGDDDDKDDSQKMPAHMARSKLYGEADPEVAAKIDPVKLKEALKRANSQQQGDGDVIDDDDDGDTKRNKKKRKKYHSMNAEVDTTEEDMEAYRLTKGRGSDPMANVPTDDVLDYKK